MSQAKYQSDSESAPTPHGFLEPSDERARRAWLALNDHRLDDAEHHLDDTVDAWQSDTAWHLFLKGVLCVCRHEFAAARIAWEGAVAATEGSPDGQRLRAMAWERLGLLHRRREELDHAEECHAAAFELRTVSGSPLEQWESAQSCALTSAMKERHDDAVARFGQALVICESISDEHEAEHCRAVTSTSLGDVLTKTAPGEAAVQVARQAMIHWHHYDVGSVDSARAEAHVGRALVRHAECIMESAPEPARAALDEAIDQLTAAKESLLAFGSVARADSLWCGDLLDFALRLRTAL